MRRLRDRLTPLRVTCLEAWRAARPELPRLGPPDHPLAAVAKRARDPSAHRRDRSPCGRAPRAQRPSSVSGGTHCAITCRILANAASVGRTGTGACSSARRSTTRRWLLRARPARSIRRLRLDDLWQALRNVWIGNNLQMLLRRPVRLTRGLFAYSMLYPVTDNLLDAPDRSSDDKRAFNGRLGQAAGGRRRDRRVSGGGQRLRPRRPDRGRVSASRLCRRLGEHPGDPSRSDRQPAPAGSQPLGGRAL